jgi:hypothetical protein
VFDPRRSADLLKSRFSDRSSAIGVDLRTGKLSYTSPILMSVGSGQDAPYRLDSSLSYAPGAVDSRFSPYGNPAGLVSNWDIRFGVSGSGMEAMGRNPATLAGSIVAFMNMQDAFMSGAPEHQKEVVATLVADWWRRQITGQRGDAYARRLGPAIRAAL